MSLLALVALVLICVPVIWWSLDYLDPTPPEEPEEEPLSDQEMLFHFIDWEENDKLTSHWSSSLNGQLFVRTASGNRVITREFGNYYVYDMDYVIKHATNRSARNREIKQFMADDTKHQQIMKYLKEEYARLQAEDQANEPTL